MKKNLLLPVLLFSYSFSFSQAESSLTQGRNEYILENYTQALKLFSKAAIEEPGNPEVPYLMAHVYSDMSDYKTSVTYFEKAIAMDSSKGKWMYECGLMYYAIPDYKRSLQYIALAGSKGYKRTLDYLENLANAYANVKQYDSAVEIYKAVIDKKPTDREILYQLGQAYFNGVKYQQALDTWQQLLTLDTTNADALYMLGLSYQKLGDKAKGQQLCDKAIAWDPSLASKKKTMGGSL